MMNKLLIICGPTATGKTALAVRLAKKFDGELISADSRQVYRGMDIGTGKDRDALYRSGVFIHLLDVVDPDDEFSVGHYTRLACSVIIDIQQRNKLPIIVGGTGLYIQSIIHPIETVVIPPNQEFRKQLSLLSTLQLQEEVQNHASDVWVQMNQSDRNNPRRLIRKLEIQQWNQASLHSLTNKCVCNFLSKDVLMIGLKASYQELYKRIDLRVDKRVSEGIIQEITQLLHKGYSWELPSMSALGYREWRQYFEDHQEKQKIIERWKFDEHGYARRQMTWFRKQKDIHWFDVGDNEIDKKVTEKVQQWYTAK